MASTPTSCPYCNAYVTVPPGAHAGQRVPCPRCGEVFPFRPPEENSLGRDVPEAPPTGPAVTTVVVPTRSGLSNRAIAGIVLGVMAVMAGVSLWWALRTVPDRRQQDIRGPLGYVPNDVNLIAAVEVRKTLDDQAGHEFLDQFGLGSVETGMMNLEKWTGLKREELNQLVLGLKFDGRRIPRLTLVVQTRDAYDVGALRKALQANKEVERGGKTLYTFTLPIQFLPLEAELWCPAKNLFIIGLTEDLDAVPAEPQTGVDRFPAPLAALLRDPLADGPQAWVVAHSAAWDQGLPGLILQQLPPAEQQTFGAVDTWGIWLRFQKQVGVHAACHTESEAAAQSLKDYLVARSVVEADEARVERGNWLIVHSTTSADGIRRTLRGLMRR